MITDWTFYLAAVPAVILMGLSKGGFAGIALLSMPLLTLVIPPIQGAAIVLPILMVQDVVSVWAFRKDFDRRNLKILLAGAMIGIFLSALFAVYVSNAFVTLLVGLIAVGFVLVWWFKGRHEAGEAKTPGVASGVFWGAAAGFTSFFANAGAPPFQVYVMPQNLSPQTFAGTATMFFAVINVVKLFAFIALGQVSAGNLATSAVLVPVAVASTLAGVWLVRRVSAESFYRLIYAFTFLVGLKLVWDGLRAFAAF